MFAPRKENYGKLSIFKSRNITLPTKVHIVKALVFPVAMYGCESWTIKKAENQITDAFELCCWWRLSSSSSSWRRLLRISWTARRSNQSILKEINPEYSLEVQIQKLKLQYVGYLMRRADHCKRPWYLERLKAKGEEGSRGWDG